MKLSDSTTMWLVSTILYRVRFASVDPLFAVSPERAMSTPQTFNTYAYAGSNPLNYSDPSGLIKVDADPKLKKSGNYEKAFARVKGTTEGKRLIKSLEGFRMMWRSRFGYRDI